MCVGTFAGGGFGTSQVVLGYEWQCWNGGGGYGNGWGGIELLGYRASEIGEGGSRPRGVYGRASIKNCFCFVCLFCFVLCFPPGTVL